MKTNQQTVSITRAYCLELKQSVSMGEARTKLFSNDSVYKRYTFVCDQPPCWNETDPHKGVLISAPNHSKRFAQTEKYVSPCFRREHSHQAGCPWVVVPTETAITLPDDGREARARKAKTTDVIQVFDMSIRAEPTRLSTPTETLNQLIMCELVERHVTVRAPGVISEQKGQTSTRDFETFVACYRDKILTMPAHERDTQTVSVTGRGKMRWVDCFQDISVFQNASTGVCMGVATFSQWYGKGFVLKFVLKRNKYPVTLYISKDLLEGHPHKETIASKIQMLANLGGSAEVFFMGILKWNNTNKTFNAIVNDLNKFVVILPA
jgi:hypothetical protein